MTAPICHCGHSIQSLSRIAPGPRSVVHDVESQQRGSTSSISRSDSEIDCRSVRSSRSGASVRESVPRPDSLYVHTHRAVRRLGWLVLEKGVPIDALQGVGCPWADTAREKGSHLCTAEPIPLTYVGASRRPADATGCNGCKVGSARARSGRAVPGWIPPSVVLTGYTGPIAQTE